VGALTEQAQGTAICRCGVVERVLTGLLGTQIGLQPVARDMLRVADHVAGLLFLPGAAPSKKTLLNEKVVPPCPGGISWTIRCRW